MARQINIPTKEEIERDKPIILKAFQEGLPMKRMEAKFGITLSYVKRIRKELIKEGLITQEEIKTAYDKYMAENPNSQGLDKRRARKKPNTERLEKKQAKSIANKEKVSELIKQGKSITEIAIQMQTSGTVISKRVNLLLAEGRISREEIVKASKDKPITEIDRNSQEYIAQIDEIVKYLRLGWKSTAIRKELDINPFYMEIYMKDIKRYRIITSKEITAARQRKKQEDLMALEEHIKSGYSIDSFEKLNPYFTAKEMTSFVKELVDAGKITREQIMKNSRDSAKRAFTKNTQLSLEEQVDVIIDKMKQGYTISEIAESDTTKSLTVRKVSYQKSKIIAEGIISKEDADMAIKRRHKSKYSEIIDIIKKYVRQGYNLREIADITDYSYVYISKLKNRYEKGNGWYTKEELQEFRRKRKIREYENLPQSEKDRIKQEKNQREADSLTRHTARQRQTQERHQEQIEQIKQYKLQGKRVSEIARLMGLSETYIYALRKESLKNGTWISDEEQELINQEKLKAKLEVQEAEKNRKQRVEERRIEAELFQLRELVTQGFSVLEIAKKMHYSNAYIYILRKMAIERGIWFSDEDIEFYKQQRTKRKSEAEIAKQKAEEERIERERRELEKTVKEEKEKRDRIERERRRNLQKYEDEYRRLRRMAKAEDKMEMNGEEEITTSGRLKFVKLLEKMYNDGAIITEKDVEIILNAMYAHPDFASKSNVKLLVVNAARSGEMDGAEKMIVTLLRELESTKFDEPLRAYRKWIRMKKMVPQIENLKAKGLSNTEIGEKLGISSAEVVVFLESDNKMPNFWDDESR